MEKVTDGPARAVYLCGPINGCSDDEANGWRAVAAAELVAAGFVVLDPMRRDFRGAEAANAAAIVHGDLFDIRKSDVLIVNAARPSWGTAMEVALASREHPRKLIVGFGAGDRPSPWLTFHCDKLVPTLADAVAIVRTWGGPTPRPA